jgi:hypothetical protein
MDNTDATKKDFFKHVFHFDEESKSDLMNTTQFAFLSLIPVILISKVIDKYIPKPEQSKSNLEILVELLIQIVLLIFGVFFTIRLVTFLPTYSGSEYPKMNETCIVFTLLFVICMLDDIVVEKVNFLMERVNDLWEGKSSDKNSITKTVNVNGKPVEVKITPTNNNNTSSQGSGNGTTSINNLPVSDSNVNNHALSQQLPNYNNMYRQDTTPLAGAQNPGVSDDLFNEPMAANDGGVGGFSSW